jgi:hypothetical protein
MYLDMIADVMCLENMHVHYVNANLKIDQEMNVEEEEDNYIIIL